MMIELTSFNFQAKRMKIWGFPSGTSEKVLPAQCRRHKRHGFDSWVWKTSWRGAWKPTTIFLPGESHGQRSLTSYGPYGAKELDTTEATQHTHTHTHILYNMQFSQESQHLEKQRICSLTSPSKYKWKKDFLRHFPTSEESFKRSVEQFQCLNWIHYCENMITSNNIQR